MWRIDLSKQADFFARTEHITDDEILVLIGKFIDSLKGEHQNIDVKKMKGDWKGYYRIKIGKIRIILKIEFAGRSIFVDRIDYRGAVYK